MYGMKTNVKTHYVEHFLKMSRFWSPGKNTIVISRLGKENWGKLTQQESQKLGLQ